MCFLALNISNYIILDYKKHILLKKIIWNNWLQTIKQENGLFLLTLANARLLSHLASSLPVTTGSRQLVVQLGAGGDVVPVHSVILKHTKAM